MVIVNSRIEGSLFLVSSNSFPTQRYFIQNGDMHEIVLAFFLFIRKMRQDQRPVKSLQASHLRQGKVKEDTPVLDYLVSEGS